MSVRRLRNLTITVEEEVARWARVWAARRNTSVSRLVGEMLKERMQQEEGYEAAMRDFFSIAPSRISDGAPYPSRDDLHDRRGLR